jgi:hypothetical protein
MAGIFQRLLLFVLSLALAMTPLGGALGHISLSTATSEHHCTLMVIPAVFLLWK